ncbi:hypothetical protein ONE63_006201 [Megalurothrips usitatus]|uniref:Calcium-activated chloride channel N-terminal domain-containing protein n=1 Tax=Megalurothrips usitatus TaxID=439358 RepID=A0AAV7XV92_9NEOP|nr:hypothetical protein ONE63_006201 [Megalurothrips usitatus]
MPRNALLSSPLLLVLQVAVSTASATLRTALDGRATLGESVVLLPDSWPDSCVPPTPGHGPNGMIPPSITPSSGETPDISVQRVDPAYGALLYTQQSRGCGQPGDQIYMSHTLLEEPVSELGRRLARELAKYRYGVFDEAGHDGDPVYPTCYSGDESDRLSLTSCSDLPLEGDHSACQNSASPNLSLLVQPSARASLMFAPGLHHVDHFCDASTHDRLAPTKHNALCGRRSVMEVINVHDDFQVADQQQKANASAPPPPTPAPSFVYKRQTLTRYVLVVEDTKDMLIRDSWLFLRTAVRKWANLDLPVNAEAGLVLVNDSSASRLVAMQALSSQAARGLVSSNLPYSPGDSHASACLACGLREALDMLEERARLGGPASSVVILLAPGTDSQADLLAAAKEASLKRIRVATINYPGVLRSAPLDAAAQVTGAPAFTVAEKGYNMATSLLGTYFRLANALADVTRHFYQGHPNNLPVEIHRRELNDMSSVTGTFVLEEGLGAPARFAVYTYNTENPLLKGVTLISPSQRTYTTRSEGLISLKMLTIAANINETGTWQYTIERFRGNPQPHFVQVTATPWSALTPVVRARLYTSTGPGPLVLYAQVTWGGAPVLGAAVEVTATRPPVPGQGVNGTASAPYREKLMLLDSGGGDPDVTRGDGIYSRYFSTLKGGAGVYTFEMTVTDNGNTAYTWKENRNEEEVDGIGACCGSALRSPAVANLSPFQRVLPPLTISLPDAGSVQSQTSPLSPPGRVGDLRADVLGIALKARLSWTAPDMGGLDVARYEVKYASKLGDLMDSFDTVASTWNHGSPFPLAPGSDTSFTMDLSRETSLLDQPFFVAIRAFPEASTGASPGPVSNWVRVLVTSPPPPPTLPPSSPSSNGSPDLPPWPLEGEGDGDSPVPRLAHGLDLGLELILPVVGGVALLAVCLAVYCYLCVLRRSHGGSGKKQGLQGLPPSSVVVTPNTTHAPLAGPDSSPGLDHKKRLSLVDPMDPMSPMGQDMTNGHPVSAPHSPQHLSPSHTAGQLVGHTGSLQRPRTLSPYQSWTASQLLHEHERRHSPYGDEQPVPAYQGYQYQGYPQHTVDGQYVEQQYYQEQAFHQPPPVPPLPHMRYADESVYGVQTQPGQQQQQPPQQQQTHGYLHSNRLLPFNPSLQGSLSSVSSGDRKKRNVTMV